MAEPIKMQSGMLSWMVQENVGV